MNGSSLLDLLNGCLDSSKVKQSEQALAQYSQSNTFLQELLILIPNQQSSMLIMVLSTLKNYIQARWSPQSNQIKAIPEDQKQILRENIFNLFYEIQSNDQAVNLYKEIQSILVLASYPWAGIDQQLQNDMNNNIFASVHFARQITKAYEYTSHQDQILKLQRFTQSYFPKLQNLVEQSLTNFNQDTAKLLFIILKAFFSTIHTHHLQYLKNQDNFSRWFIYVKTILSAGLQKNQLNQRISARIVSRMLNQYLNPEVQSKYMKGWSQSMRERHGQQFAATIFHCIQNPNGDEETASQILNGVIALSKHDGLRCFLDSQKVNYIIYDRLLPNLQTSQEDISLFSSDPFEYIRKYVNFIIRRQQDICSYMFKRNAEDAIQYLVYYCVFNQKSELMNFIEYTAGALQSNSTSDKHKEVLIKQISIF